MSEAPGGPPEGGTRPGTGRTASSGQSRARHRATPARRGWLRRPPAPGRGSAGSPRPAITAWVSVMAIILIGLTAVVAGRVNLRAAEDERLAERAELVKRIGEYITSTYHPRLLADAAARTGFPKDDPTLTAGLLQQFRTGATGDHAAQAALVRRDGSTLAVSPTGGRVPLAQLGPAWSEAMAGRPSRSGVFSFAGSPAWATVVPVGSPTPWAALVVIQRAVETSAQVFIRQLGALGSGAGGFSWVDGGGRARLAWKPSLLGRQVLDPGQPPTPSSAVITTIGSGPDPAIRMIYRFGDDASVFEQSSTALFADLTSQQRRRDLTLFSVLTVAVLVLLLTSVRRVRAVRRSRSRLHALLSNSQDLILVARPNGDLTFVSPAITPLLGCRPQVWQGRPVQELVHPDDAPRLLGLLADPDGVRKLLDVRFVRLDGDPQWFDIEAADASGSPELRGLLLTCHDVAARRRLQQKLEHQAHHDALTGLPNRRMLGERLQHELEQGLADPTRPATAVLFVDLDGFKPVNDTWGHAAGDAVLRLAAQRLVAAVREGDLVSRCGGDEFGIVLPYAGEELARQVAARIVTAVADPFPLDVPADGSQLPETSARIGASVGVALADHRLDDAELVLRVADQAMYEAKQSGRGRYVVHRLGEPESAAGPGQRRSDPSADARGPAQPRPAPSPFPHPQAQSQPQTQSQPAASEVSPPRSVPARRQAAGFTPLLAAIIAILSVAGVGLYETAAAQAIAERQRTQERLIMTARVADYADVIGNPQRLLAPANAAPWRLDGSHVDSLILATVLASELGGSGAQGALLTTSGRLLASSTAGLPPGITIADPTWRVALTGRVGYVPLVSSHGTYYGSYAIPILRGPGPAAVLVIAQMLSRSVPEQMLQVLGSLGFGTGGVSSVERTGRATHSWNPALIGRRLLDPRVRATLPARGASVVAGPAGYVTLAAPITATLPSGTDTKVIVFQQPTSVFFGDLRTGQRLRDVILLLVVLVAIGVLGVGSWQREQAVRRGQRRLDALFSHSHDIVAVFDGPTATFISSAMTGLLGHDPRAWLNRPWTAIIHPDDDSRLTECLSARDHTTLHGLRLITADGRYLWFDVHVVDLSAHPDIRGRVVTFHEVTERKALQDELSYRANHDPLTGLPNRTVFADLVEQATRSAADGGPGYCLLYLDLDRFKPVNDTFGHAAGDDVLRAVTRALLDVVPAGTPVCRLGGDEFIVLLAGFEPLAATTLAALILDRLEQPIPLSAVPGRTVQIGATVGIAHGGGSEPSAAVIRQADQAMYRAKKAGRGRIALHAGLLGTPDRPVRRTARYA